MSQTSDTSPDASGAAAADNQPQSPPASSTPSVEDIAANVNATGEAFDKAVADAVAVLLQLNAALAPYRGQLPQQLRFVVDAIAAMQGAGTKQ